MCYLTKQTNKKMICKKWSYNLKLVFVATNYHKFQNSFKIIKIRHDLNVQKKSNIECSVRAIKYNNECIKSRVLIKYYLGQVTCHFSTTSHVIGRVLFIWSYSMKMFETFYTLFLLLKYCLLSLFSYTTFFSCLYTVL